MSFIMDVFFEFLALLLGLVGMICSFAGVVVVIIGALLSVTSVSNFLTDYLFDPSSLPSWFGWILGVMIVAIGILLMALSSVMRKRISNPRR